MKNKILNLRNITRPLIRDDGWTLLEMGIVIVIVITVTVFAINRVRSPTENLGPAVAQLVAADIAFAQELAVSSGKGISISVIPGAIDDCDDDNHGHGDGHDNDGDDHDRGHGNDDDHDDDDNPGHGGDDDDDGNNGHGNDDDHDDDSNPGHGNGHNDDDDDDDDDGNHGHGNDDDHDDDDNPGQGHGNDGDRSYGRGRGHGHGFGRGHDCEASCSGAGYTIEYSDGSVVPYPPAAETQLDGGIVLESNVEGIRFDSGGRLIVPNYTWQAGQTYIVIMVLDGNIEVRLARETGKITIVNG